MLTNLPTYPKFKTLDLTDRLEIVKYLSLFEPYSDFNYTSMFCWRSTGISEVSKLNNNLIIRMPNYLNGTKKVYSLLGSTNIDETIHTLLEKTNELELVPQETIDSIKLKTDYIITESPENHDYIYDLNELSTFSGQKFKKHRNKSNRFIQDHNEHNIEVIVSTTIQKKHMDIIRNIDHEWSIEFDKNANDIRSEKYALSNLLDNAESFNLFVVEISVNGQMKAFSINEILSDGYAICHFEKALKSHHNYIATYLVNVVAQKLLEYGCSYSNWEQDLGLEGLRQSKSSFRPTKYLKKYTVTKR